MIIVIDVCDNCFRNAVYRCTPRTAKLLDRDVIWFKASAACPRCKVLK